MDWSEKIARSPDLRSKLVEASQDERSERWGGRTARESDSGLVARRRDHAGQVNGIK
jgi:hypothetical protein